MLQSETYVYEITVKFFYSQAILKRTNKNMNRVQLHSPVHWSVSVYVGGRGVGVLLCIIGTCTCTFFLAQLWIGGTECHFSSTALDYRWISTEISRVFHGVEQRLHTDYIFRKWMHFVSHTFGWHGKIFNWFGWRVNWIWNTWMALKHCNSIAIYTIIHVGERTRFFTRTSFLFFFTTIEKAPWHVHCSCSPNCDKKWFEYKWQTCGWLDNQNSDQMLKEQCDATWIRCEFSLMPIVEYCVCWMSGALVSGWNWNWNSNFKWNHFT